ncbi:hypothetical protein SNEBB_006281 [Seison nebaliae]|nr:hypothetical protein SNEBB_006281 [Seison nebaliae]
MISLQQKQPSEKNLTFVDVILTEILSLIKNEEVDAYNFWNNALDYIRGKLMVVYHLVNAYKGDKASEIHAID